LKEKKIKITINVFFLKKKLVKEPNFDEFEEANGFEDFVRLIAYSSTKILFSEELSDMALWLLKEFINSSEEYFCHIKWLICLLDDNHVIPPKIKKKLSSMSRASSTNSFNDPSVTINLPIIPDQLKATICKLLSDLFNFGSKPEKTKLAFRTNGGIEILIELLGVIIIFYCLLDLLFY